MLLFGLLLLTSALAGQRHGTQAESNLSSKFQFSSNKEQNEHQEIKFIAVDLNGLPKTGLHYHHFVSEVPESGNKRARIMKRSSLKPS
ncbi:hypothetical protein MC885_008027 [Smutsia gigantea]|nr:hypothetical protein MC885_008027 [Smutsia gigantea]